MSTALGCLTSTPSPAPSPTFPSPSSPTSSSSSPSPSSPPLLPLLCSSHGLSSSSSLSVVRAVSAPLSPSVCVSEELVSCDHSSVSSKFPVKELQSASFSAVQFSSDSTSICHLPHYCIYNCVASIVNHLGQLRGAQNQALNHLAHSPFPVHRHSPRSKPLGERSHR